jgi:tripartite-type tricarboxylate transporter receptor subunit TctC
VQAAPDGYTIGIGHVGTHVQNGALHQLPYDLLKDLEPIALLPANPR